MRVPLSIPPSAVFILVMLFPLSFAVLGEFESGKPILIVRQSPVAPQKLEIVPNGVDFLRSVNLPITPVVVIGPYRSGKSFLLNQLLGTECSKGFGVGHQRHAETKGIWMWSVPQIYQSRAIMYIDTEGFESAGKAAVYDSNLHQEEQHQQKRAESQSQPVDLFAGLKKNKEAQQQKKGKNNEMND